MNTGLGAYQHQQQKLSLGMIQSLKMLQVTTLELEQMLWEELEHNPLLEIDDGLRDKDDETKTDDDDSYDMDMDDDRKLSPDSEKNGEAEQKTESDTSSGAESETLQEKDNETENNNADKDESVKELDNSDDNSIDWEEYLDNGFDFDKSYNDEYDSGEERYEVSPVYQETLAKYLNNQLKDKKIGERIRFLVQFLIGSLDEDGYLRDDIKEIADYTGATENEMEEALNVLRKFDPAGVGARDLHECMALQLRALGMGESLTMKIITDYWDMLEKLRIPEISRKLHIEPREVQAAIDVIKTLNPKPGYQFADKSSAIHPDLIVKKEGKKFIVLLNEHSIPSLRINKTYAAMTKRNSGATKDVKEYIRDRLNNANLFIKGIEQRRNTMLKIMEAIISRQKEFFEEGPPNLAPLKQQEIADMIGMHISTISRATTEKYVQTPYGIFELKYFFTDAMGSKAATDGQKPKSDNNDASGVDITAEPIKNRIKQLIKNEEPSNPLSDQEIEAILKEEGLPAARRTVAKYREQMKIPIARMRRRYE